MSFEQFWAMYPRKCAKPVAAKSFNRLSTNEQVEALEALPNHIKFWQSVGTEKQFIPHPATWLNQQRFYDDVEIEEAKPVKQPQLAWWSSEPLIIAKGQELNLSPRPGESIHEFKGRVAEKIRLSA